MSHRSVPSVPENRSWIQTLLYWMYSCFTIFHPGKWSFNRCRSWSPPPNRPYDSSQMSVMGLSYVDAVLPTKPPAMETVLFWNSTSSLLALLGCRWFQYVSVSFRSPSHIPHAGICSPGSRVKHGCLCSPCRPVRDRTRWLRPGLGLEIAAVVFSSGCVQKIGTNPPRSPVQRYAWPTEAFMLMFQSPN